MRDHARVRLFAIVFGLASLALWPLLGADAARGLPPLDKRASAVCLNIFSESYERTYDWRVVKGGKWADQIGLQKPLFLGLPTVDKDIATTFSSRGPSGDFTKPDITAPGVSVVNVPENKINTTLLFGESRQEVPALVNLEKCVVMASLSAPLLGGAGQGSIRINPRYDTASLTIKVTGTGNQKGGNVVYALLPTAIGVAPVVPPGPGEPPPPPPVVPGGPPPPPGTGWGLDASCRWDKKLRFTTTIVSDTGGLPGASVFPKTLDLELMTNPPNLRWHCPVEQGMDLDQSVVFTDSCAFRSEPKTFNVGGNIFSPTWTFKYERGNWNGDLFVSSETVQPTPGVPPTSGVAPTPTPRFIRTTNIRLNQLPGGPSPGPTPVVPILENTCVLEGVRNFTVTLGLDKYNSGRFVNYATQIRAEFKPETGGSPDPAAIKFRTSLSGSRYSQSFITTLNPQTCTALANWKADAAGQPNREFDLKLYFEFSRWQGDLRVQPRDTPPDHYVFYGWRERF